MLVLARICGYLLYLARGDVPRINPTDAPALRMNFEHDLGGPFPRQREEELEDLDHEFHRRVVVVVHDDLVHGRRLGLGLARLRDRGAAGFVGHCADGRTLNAENLRIPLGWIDPESNMDKREAFFKTLQALGPPFPPSGGRY